MDIVDTQLHIGPRSFEPVLEAMDSLGVRSVMLEEYWVEEAGKGPIESVNPGYRMPNGAWRAIFPIAQLAATLHPDRFTCIVRIDRTDPDLEAVMRIAAAGPQVRAFRCLASWTRDDAAALASGGYDAMFDIAQDIGLPICLFVPGHVEHLPRYLEKYPRLQFVLDHIGMGMPNHPPGRDAAEAQRSMQIDYFDEVLKLAAYPNIAVKLSHAPFLLRAGTFPFAAVRPHLRRAIGAFGKERLMWASDQTVMRAYSWADLLNYLLFDPELSDEEKAWLLGRSARTVFDWPATTAQGPAIST
jgi:predicted TIM-barrel fold metal-dependent hydrolase